MVVYVEIDGEKRDVRELVIEALEETKKYIPVVIQGVDLVADKLEKEETQEALDLMAKLMEGISWVMKVIQNSIMLLGLKGENVADGKLIEASQALTHSLEDAMPSLQDGKFFELAYRLREEILPRFRDMKPYVDELHDIATKEE
ncbi:MAG: hypothetical protein GX487_00205 [Acetomicrobium flavidum]|uniref:hypothetical protein n=1 Tax=Acetomicrobium flavidum TaxID=49896 RepID=UPI0008FEE65A|nr:hypothetical protein [Acetomicrobium flavidum]HOM30599.1 hypothetical protein [Acetomicrobium flavidum]HPP13830.1 hypothetical protein [Acetomicrobium flavidum]HPU69478.1 hypothetical protein [Acetomicrobium flavidum]